MDYLKLLPHQYPFRFVDKVLECQPGKWAMGTFLITADSNYLLKINTDGKQKVIFPNSLLVEAIAQIGAIAVLSNDQYKGYRTMLTGINQTEFFDLASIDDELIIFSEIVSLKGKFGRRQGEIKVKDKVIASGLSNFILVKEDNLF